MKMLHLALAGLLCAATVHVAEVAHAADPVAPTDFAWTASVETAPHQGLVRLPVPGGALARLQSATAADLRMFDGEGRPVPFAVAAAPRAADAARAQGASFTALPLFSAQAGSTPPRGAVQVRVDDGGQRQSLWVQLDPAAGAGPATAQPLTSALFDTRRLQEALSAIVVHATLPSNVPVRVTLSTSADLESWTPVQAQGRLYRFDGAAAPANDTLELRAPLSLAGRYLRLDWAGQDGVRVTSVAGLTATAPSLADHPAIVLPAPAVDDATAREWQLDFATPLAAIDIATPQPNTLVPLRVLGRSTPSGPWRTLATTVAYRIGPPGQESTNAPVPLRRQSVRWLRVEATHGASLAGTPLAVRVLFEPQELVFLAGAGGPYTLAAGRPDTPAAALPLPLLAGTAASTAPPALPLARIGAVRESGPRGRPAWAAWLPPGTDVRTLGLWAVLALGVLVLGGVAWGLLRQVGSTEPPRP